MNATIAGMLSRGRPLAIRVIGSRFNRRFAWVMWAWVRASALRGFRRVFRGVRVEWDMPGHARIVPFEVAGPSRDEVLLRTVISTISPGTERAYYRVEPNAVEHFPQYPGYSMVGEVLRVGSKVKHLQRGQLVAAPAAHGSLAVVPVEGVFPLPEGVTPEEGAFVTLGIIALHGVWRGELRPGERVAVLGRGPIGQLAVQLCHALGAGQVLSIAPSRRHSTPALRRFARRVIATFEEGEAILDTIQADVTYESSGEPQAVRDALRATRDGGRVVLLGSPRGVTQGFDFGGLADRGISLVGAHLSTLSRDPSASSHSYRQAGETLLRLVAEGALDIPSLVSQEVDPWEAGEFYRQLAQAQSQWVGAVFRWDGLRDVDRLQRVSYWTPPELEMARGNWMSEASSPRSLVEGKPSESHGVEPVRRPKGTGDSRTLRLAVIGCGGRGSTSASDAQRARGTSLAMVMDVNEGLARQVGERLGVPWTTSYEAVLSDRGVDAVFISTPHHVHEEQAVMAASAAKHIIVEKPLGHNLEAAARIVAAARKGGVSLSTCLELRYLPQVVKARQLVKDGAVGDLLGATLAYHLYKPPSYWQRGYSGGNSDWRARWETAGGGVLIMNAIHYLDWLLYLGDMKVTEVSARYAVMQGGVEVEDTVVMWLTFENGALATVNTSSRVQGLHQPPELVDCRMWGTQGHLSLTPPFQFFSSRFIDGKRPERWHSLGPLPRLHSPNIEYLEHFSNAVLNGREVDITGEDGLRLQAVIEAAYRSSREGRNVRVEYPST
ncbi:MAG: zinc-binding dehydrogenase [Dehalococcoidia bacterium]|nr:zinc-binding dehydrogenase [Dehalococcoidia bacterium]